KAAGARVQRPLWASTGTKNPAYSDTMYIDHLIGPDTVNTVPPKTLMAFADHGNVSNSLTVGVEESQELMDMLAEVGIDIDEVTKRLQDDGVEAFVDSFKNLLEQVEAKRAVLRSKIIRRQNAALGVYTDPVNEALEKMDADFVNGRIWNKDGS